MQSQRERGGKKGVFVVRLGGGIDLPSSWLARFFFRLSGTVSFLIRTPTHTHKHTLTPKALPPFFCRFPFSLPHCPRSISASPSCCLIPPPKHTVTHTHTYSSSPHCNCIQIKYMILHPPPTPSFSAFPLFPLHMRTISSPALPNAYFRV